MSDASRHDGPGYRPDIDGLRAVAVLGVLLFHAGAPFLPGGYVGVDVFFVISGYLITSIILREQRLDRFSFLGFYARRARRIVPALAVMLLATSLAASWLLLPDDLARFGRSLMGAALSGSNVLFWLEDGYFATSSELEPLLHTWSLSIEEQFYLLHPALLLLVRKASPKQRALAIALVLLASLGVCVVATGRFAFAYYLLPSRAWELLCGALLAAWPPTELPRRARHVAGISGIGLIALAFAAFSSATPFPGHAALVPCAGAALVILGGSSGLHVVGRLLSSRLCVYVGRRSYSAYLWHWPLLVLPKYYLVRPLTPVESLLSLAVTFALTELSYRFVETPFRRPRAQASPHSLALAGATLALVVAVGGSLAWARGFPDRVSLEVRALEHAQVELDVPDPSCLVEGSLEDVPRRPGCYLGARSTTPSFVLWGDSHGSAISVAVARAAQPDGRAGLVLTHNGCPSLVGATLFQGSEPVSECLGFATRVMEGLTRASRIQDVVLASRWSMYVHGYLPSETAGDVGPEPVLWDGQSAITEDDDRARVLERALTLTATRLRASGKRVFVVDPIPEIGQDVPSTLARLARFHGSRELSLSSAEYAERNELVLRILGRLERAGLIFRLSPERRLCDAERCVVRAGSLALYADEDHLSHAGARFVAPAFEEMFER